MTADLVIPALFLGFLGWLIPRLLSLVFAEGVRPLIGLTVTSALLLYLIGAGVFLGLYLYQGIGLRTLLLPGLGPTLLHFARLGLAAALIWGPIMLLSVAGLPRHWVHKTW